MINSDKAFPVLNTGVQESLVQYLKVIRDHQRKGSHVRENFRRIDLAYQREQNLTEDQWRAKLANRAGDAARIQDVAVPIVMPQVESFVAYQSDVFLTNTPLFGMVANPENIDAARQMEAIIDDQAIRGGWVDEFIMSFRDAAKYNFFALEVDWLTQYVPRLDTDLKFSASQAKPSQILWAGNTIKRIDPYNIIRDARVPPSQIHSRGEFVGYTERLSRIEMKAYLNQLADVIKPNVVKALQSAPAQGTSSNWLNDAYYEPQINYDTIYERDNSTNSINWVRWARLDDSVGQKIDYKDIYFKTVLYARILPSDFGLKVPEYNTPQIWKFVFVNDAVLVLAERQTNAHNLLPIICGQAYEDGLGYQTKSLAANGEPLQQINSALWASVIAGLRRSINDRMLYDPSRVSPQHINNPNPAAKIPVRAFAYGKPLNEAVYPFPYRLDNLGDIIGLTTRIEQMADKSSGQNPARQGQFVKGNKTRQEFDTIMNASTSSDQLVSLHLEAKVFTPIKEILKLNILQYQTATEIFSRTKEELIEVDPINLRKAVMAFKVTDGLTTADKIIPIDVLREGFQTLANMPQLANGYNLSPMFSYLLKTQKLDIKPFEKSPEQIAYEQALQTWQQTLIQLLQSNPNLNPKSLPPQPLPQQFGYTPQGNNVAAGQQDKEDASEDSAESESGSMEDIVNNMSPSNS